MNTHDKYELPPLPRGDIAADTCPTMWVHTDQQLQDYARSAIEPYAKRIEELEAQIEADRKRRGEPDYYTYVINGWYRGISNAAPPDGSYDEGTLQPLYTVLQPLSESNIPAYPVKELSAAEISDVIREVTGCPDIKSGDESLVAKLSSLLASYHQPPQPDDPDLAKCAECGAEMIHVRPGKWQHPDCPQSPGTSEPVKADAKASVLSDLRNAVFDLISTWREQQSEYPAEGKLAAAAVRLCANELEDLLARYGNQENSNG